MEGFLLFLVSAAVGDAHGRRQVQALDGLLYLCHPCAEVGALQASGDNHHPLQIFAANLILRRQLLDGCERAERGRVP